MDDNLIDLRNILAYHLLSGPYDPNANQEERHRIDYLIELVEDYEVGDITFDQLQTIFKRQDVPGFDLNLWLQSMVEQGIYHID